jgi:hypothetical protein
MINIGKHGLSQFALGLELGDDVVSLSLLNMKPLKKMHESTTTKESQNGIEL